LNEVRRQFLESFWRDDVEEHEASKFETAADVEDKIQELEDLYQVRTQLRCVADSFLFVID
jgi:hypothetical protein